jgi:hypothetical protein
LQSAHVAGGWLSFSIFSYLAFAHFGAGIRSLYKKDFTGAAQSIAVSLGASGGALANLAVACAALAKLGAKVATIALGTVGSLVCAGLGPAVALMLSAIELKKLHAALKEPMSDTKRQVHINKQRLETLKILGALLITGLQISLILGTGGISVGIMVAISVGYLAITTILEWVNLKKEKAVQCLEATAMNM